MRRSARSFLILVLLLSPQPAFSRSTSFDTLRMRPATGQAGYLTVYGTDILPRYEWVAGSLIDYAKEPLSLVLLNGTVQPVVDNLIGLHLTGSMGLLDWLEVGLNPNAAVYEKFYDTTTNRSGTRIRMGETRVNFKLQLLDREDHPLGVSFVPYIDLPTGSGASYVGNNSFSGGGLFSIETAPLKERLSFALNLGYLARDKVTVFGITPFDDLMTFGLAGNLKVVDKIDLYSELAGGTMVSDFFSGVATPMEGGAGARFFPTDDRRWQVTAGLFLGAGIGDSGLGNPLIRALAGIAYTPAPPVEEKPQETESFSVYELGEASCPFDIEGAAPGTVLESDPQCIEIKNELIQKCPEKSSFDPDRDDIRCLKLY
ncbi:MAG: transporter [Deltaproteobacteria bacterium]|nr:transporter [Deltaproteobacteria bacterium]MBI4374778.1 transporter [Deltaproteobacteria bacterium]